MPAVRFPVEESDATQLRRETWRDLIRLMGDMQFLSDESPGSISQEMIQERYPSREKNTLEALRMRLPGGAQVPANLIKRLLFLMYLRRAGVGGGNI